MAGGDAPQAVRLPVLRVLWTRLARTDRAEIRLYIERDNPAAALALDELFSEKVGLLAAHPGLGRPGRVSATREWVVHPNYILVYDVDGEVLRILRLLHAARLRP